MPISETAARTIPARLVGDDHVGVFTNENAVLLVVADGAGGQRGGGAASQFVVARAAAQFEQLGEVIDPKIWVEWMSDIDRVIQADSSMGETTAVVCVIEDGKFVAGASVGDSAGLLVASDTVVDLTHGQKRKPLLGSGTARPHPFFFRRSEGTIVLGTDGLFTYAARERIIAIVRENPFDGLLDALVAAVRLPSGALQDDVGIVVYRHRRQQI